MRLSDLLESADYDLQAKYDHFNQTLFDGKLPRIPLVWKKLKNVGGQIKYSIRRDPSIPAPGPVPKRYRKLVQRDRYEQGYRVLWPTVVMEMSNLWQRTEAQTDGILVHEMIHVWMLVENVLDESHGSKFLAKVRELRTKVPFDIPLTEVSDQRRELTDQETLKSVGVAYGIKKDGSVIYMMIGANLARQAAEAMKAEWTKEVQGDYPLFTGAKLLIVKNAAWTHFASRRPVGRVAVKSVKPSKTYGTTMVWPKRYQMSPATAATLIPALGDAEVLWSLG